MASIKEEDNSVFKGLGKNHDRSFNKQINPDKPQESIDASKYNPVLK